MSEHLIREEVNAKIKEAMRRQKHTLVSTLHEKISSKLDLPSIEELLSCSREDPLEWDPVFRRVPGQSHRSFQEQNKAFKLIKRKLHLQLQGKAPKHGCLVGPPGSGKSLLSHVTALYAVSIGLRVGSTAFPAEQAMLIGGLHLHKMFCLNVNQSKHSHPLIDPDNCMNSLSKKLWLHYFCIT